jgi:endonuclease YncB( thermonuclease family)
MSGRGNNWMVRRPVSDVYTPELNMSISLAIVESVRDGTTLRVRVFMPDGEHQFVNITLAGARSPRTASRQGETSEPLGEEVRRSVPQHMPPVR